MKKYIVVGIVLMAALFGMTAANAAEVPNVKVTAVCDTLTIEATGFPADSVVFAQLRPYRGNYYDVVAKTKFNGSVTIVTKVAPSYGWYANQYRVQATGPGNVVVLRAGTFTRC